MTARGTEREWFAERGGLRFECTLCGNCCSGPPGYVLVSDEEAHALATRLGLSVRRFLDEYTHMTGEGRSLKEKSSSHGLDCVFLDRESVPGKAVCSVYEDRPAQCRTWPFWPSVVRTESSWKRAKRTCPGMDTGRLIPPERIRILRDGVDI